MGLLAGVDEAGRGPLAGPVVAAAVVIENGNYPDSKSISHKQRLELFEIIMVKAQCVSIAAVSPSIIDALDIRKASLLAMRRAIEELPETPELVLIDGRDIIPGLVINQKAIIGGDRIIPSIGAASIIAKVARDCLMCSLDEIFENYNFSSHKGYPTKYHYKAIENHGIRSIHRFSFRLR
jgi:ribonuclease HII